MKDYHAVIGCFLNDAGLPAADLISVFPDMVDAEFERDEIMREENQGGYDTVIIQTIEIDAESVDEACDAAYTEGYDTGYNDGAALADDTWQNAYDDGYADGWEKRDKKM